MMKKSLIGWMVFGVVLTAAPFASESSGATASNSSSEIPLTTASEAARRVFRGGLENIENQQTQRAHVDFRAAVRFDSDFALAHLFLAYDSGNPAEEASELLKARTLGTKASKPEQLLITWLAGARTGEYVTAISAMNDLLSDYPHDRFLLFLAGRWMVQQRNFDGAQRFLLRAVASEANYPAALNELAYAYAYTGDFKHAFETLDKYEAALPGEPNTEDSYGEISRLAGRYDQALEHYHKALSFDRTFIWSQVGLADTYLLMGKEEQAREEYARAVAAAPSIGDRLTWEIQSALTYLYADDSKSFYRAMQSVADEAHATHIGLQEAKAYHYMSIYPREPKDVMEYERKAEEVLSRATGITATDHDQQLASVLSTEAIHSALAGNIGTANEALQALRTLALHSRSEYVQRCSEGAQGGVLWAEKKYADAIPHLEEDEQNQMSGARLVQAYRRTGDARRADDMLQRLNQYHEATIEDLLARRMLNEQNSKQ